jgi:hypothetical protein
MVNDAALFAYSTRERAPTIPFDLSEYAWNETGPASWTAQRDAAAFSAWVLEGQDDHLCARTTELLVTISPTDVPHVAESTEHVLSRLSLREAFVVASIDGESTLEVILDSLDMPAGEALSIVCELCATGVIVLDS